MARHDEADVALLQEAGRPPGDLTHLVSHDDVTFQCRHLYDRWPMIVQLSDRVKVDRFRQVSPISEYEEADLIKVSDIGTMVAARITPHDDPDDAFIAVSMYSRWMLPHPSTGIRRFNAWAADESAHRILSDLSAFISHNVTTRHRILAAGDLNLIYATEPIWGGERAKDWFHREWTVWRRFDALGLEFLGPQLPNGRAATAPRPPDSLNVPTYKTSGEKSPAESWRQLDYAFASRGFHEQVSVRALNGIDEWGPSDHCRLLIEVGHGNIEQ